MSAGFLRAVTFVLRHEGGLVEDARGGLTKFGISQKAYPDLDIAGLTRDAAIDIYHRDYWRAARCDLVPWPLDLALLDGAVQHGPETAVTFLQRALRVTVDGDLGPETHHAASTAPTRDVLAEYLVHRAEFYLGIIPPGPLRGWGRRLFDLAFEAGEGRP